MTLFPKNFIYENRQKNQPTNQTNKQTKKQTEKTIETKSWFFETINKIDKPLARLIKKIMERAQINKFRNKIG